VFGLQHLNGMQGFYVTLLGRGISPQGWVADKLDHICNEYYSLTLKKHKVFLFNFS
jgi:hypothetical protein